DEETSLRVLFKLIMVIKALGYVGDCDTVEEGDKEYLKEWWKENRNRIVAEHKAQMLAVEEAERARDESRRKQARYYDEKNEIEAALKGKNFEGVTVLTHKFDGPPVEISKHKIFLPGRSGMLELKAVDILNAIESATKVEELKELLKQPPSEG